MKYEKAVGAVIYKEEEGKKLYLLLYYPTKHWNFSKGRVEKGESEIETAKREIMEETSLTDLEFIDGFREKNEYFLKREGKAFFKTVVFFLARTKTKDVKISFEHRGFVWLPYGKAIRKIRFKNAREVLRKANDFILEKSI